MEVGAKVVEAKEEDEEEDEKKEKEKKEKEKEKEDNKIGVVEKVSTIAMPGAGLLLLFWGLQRGYPLWTCFLAFLIRVKKEISCLVIGSDFWNLSFC